MVQQTRRTFLKVSGAVLGGIATGTTVTAAESAERWILDSSNVTQLRGVDVIHELEQIDVAVVEGTESDVSELTNTYVNDLLYQLEPPADGELFHEYEERKGGKGSNKTQEDSATESDGEATDEPLYHLQWDKQALDIPAVHDYTRGSSSTVAIIDSGVASGHPDLSHAYNGDLSKNFARDDYGVGEPYGGYHGTHVSGIVAANDANDAGIVGTAPGTDLIDCRVFSPLYGGAYFADIIAAILYSANVGADAANLSLGAYPIPREGLGNFYGKVLNRSMTWANKEGTVLSIAAGNDSADLQHDGNFISIPNEGAQAVSVSATGPIGFMWDADGDGEVMDLEDPPESPAFYTNYGTNAIDIGAPGGDADLDAIGTGVPYYYDLVLSTIAEPKFGGSGKYLGAEYSYGWAAGTSMAAPQITGAVALVRDLYPETTSDDVEAKLERAASVPDGYDKAFYGSGFLNILDALK